MRCSGICSERKLERTFVVECDENDLMVTSWVVAHEVGHLLGISHDFQKYKLYTRPKQSLEGNIECYQKHGIMDYINKNYNNLKWTACSVEDFRVYHGDVKNHGDSKFCLDPLTSISNELAEVGRPITITCDTRTCREIHYVNWYYNSYGSETKVRIATISPPESVFNYTQVSETYTHDVTIFFDENGAILKISNFMDINSGTYQCEIVTYLTESVCKTHQETSVGVKMPKSKISFLFYTFKSRGLFNIKITIIYIILLFIFIIYFLSYLCYLTVDCTWNGYGD